MYMHIMMHCCL